MPPRLGGTSTACFSSASRGTMSSAVSSVEASTTKHAPRPDRRAASSPPSPAGHPVQPGNLYWGAGVTRLFPIRRWCSRNSAVTTANGVGADVLDAGPAAPVTKKPRERVKPAGLKLAAEHVARGPVHDDHRPAIPRDGRARVGYPR